MKITSNTKLSKDEWTRRQMLEAIEDCGVENLEKVKNMKTEDIFNKFFDIDEASLDLYSLTTWKIIEYRQNIKELFHDSLEYYEPELFEIDWGEPVGEEYW